MKRVSDRQDQGLRTYGSTFSFKLNGHKVMVNCVGGYFFGNTTVSFGSQVKIEMSIK